MEGCMAITAGSLHAEITHAINRHSAENGSNTPDFILATYLLACLNAFDLAVNARTDWYGIPRDHGFGRYHRFTDPEKPCPICGLYSGAGETLTPRAQP